MPEHDCLPLDQTVADVVSTFGEMSGLPPRGAPAGIRHPRSRRPRRCAFRRSADSPSACANARTARRSSATPSCVARRTDRRTRSARPRRHARARRAPGLVRHLGADGHASARRRATGLRRRRDDRRRQARRRGRDRLVARRTVRHRRRRSPRRRARGRAGRRRACRRSPPTASSRSVSPSTHTWTCCATSWPSSAFPSTGCRLARPRSTKYSCAARRRRHDRGRPCRPRRGLRPGTGRTRGRGAAEAWQPSRSTGVDATRAGDPPLLAAEVRPGLLLTIVTLPAVVNVGIGYVTQIARSPTAIESSRTANTSGCRRPCCCSWRWSRPM